MNSTVKLIGEAKKIDNGFIAVVQPMIVSNEDYFSKVNYAYNSVAFMGDNSGELKFYGSGAGKLPTADAVLNDVLDIVRRTIIKNQYIDTEQMQNANETIVGEYYIRVNKPSEKLKIEIKNISNEILEDSKIIAVMTKEVKYKYLLNIVSSNNLNKADYFIGKILK